jgi:RsiW-degrading membrane proteinase PrsW (M82 family)
VLLAVAVAFLGSLVGLVWIRYLDRREPESWWYWIGVLVFAMLFTVTPAVVFNSISPFVFTIGFNEEFWKVLPLLLLILFAPTTVNGVRDGMIYGALGGFAFNMVEIADYFLLDTYPAQGIAAGLTEALARLSFWGIGVHVIWSMLVGAGIGLAVQTQNRRTKILAPLGAYLLAAITHSIQDMGVGVILMAVAMSMLLTLQGAEVDVNDPTAGPEIISENLRWITRIEAILINIIILPIVIAFLLKSGNWEREVIQEGLADESDAVITPEEYEGVKAERRFRLRRLSGFPRRIGRQVRNAQNRLAFHKAYLRRKSRPIEGDPLIEYYRAEVIRLRSGAAQEL